LVAIRISYGRQADLMINKCWAIVVVSLSVSSYTTPQPYRNLITSW